MSSLQFKPDYRFFLYHQLQQHAVNPGRPFCVRFDDMRGYRGPGAKHNVTTISAGNNPGPNPLMVLQIRRTLINLKWLVFDGETLVKYNQNDSCLNILCRTICVLIVCFFILNYVNSLDIDARMIAYNVCQLLFETDNLSVFTYILLG